MALLKRPMYGRSGVTNVVDSQTLPISHLLHFHSSVGLLQVFRHTSLAIRTCETLLIRCCYVIRFPLSKPLRLETREEPPALLRSQAPTFVTNLSSLVAFRR